MRTATIFLQTMLGTYLTIWAATLAFADGGHAAQPWQELFNGKDLNDWTVKIAGQAAGEDGRQVEWRSRCRRCSMVRVRVGADRIGNNCRTVLYTGRTQQCRH